MPSNRRSADIGSTDRGPRQGNRSLGDSNSSGLPRTFGRGSNGNESLQFNRSFGNTRARGDATSDSANRIGRAGGNDSSSRSQEWANRLRDGGGDRGNASSWSQSRRQHATGRPTNDQVRNFLDLRRDGAVRQAGNLSDRSFERNPSRRGGDANVADNVPDSIRQFNRRRGGDNWQGDGDRSWSRRFGKGDSDRGNPNRNFGDRNFVDRNYQDWRKGAWRGQRGEGFDHRDQSGRWKDGDRFVAAHRIRDHWKGHQGRHDVPFRGGWWDKHHRHGRHWHHWDRFAHRHHSPFYWWSWCPAPRLTAWISYGWPTPYYWDYGPGEYIYCYDGVIYVNGVWFQPAPLYHEQTLVLAQYAPDWTAEQAAQADWLPLGVFAVARDGVADANVLLQLAVTQDGVIAGTVFNQLTGATFAIEGAVDKQTQRAVWTYVDATNARIVMETSIFNLTQPEATGLVHYGPDNIQVIQLVRLEEPAEGAAPAVGP